jgi:hypothetical protein
MPTVSITSGLVKLIFTDLELRNLGENRTNNGESRHAIAQQRPTDDNPDYHGDPRIFQVVHSSMFSDGLNPVRPDA